MEIDKNSLLNGYGLSCIENYVIAILKKYISNWETIFFKSFILFEDILRDFAVYKEKYAYFSGVERIQDVCSELGLIQINYESNISMEEIQDDLDFAFVRVNEKFIRDNYKTKLWREDHFIYVKKMAEGWFFVNDTPLDEGRISNPYFEQIFSNECFYLSLNRRHLEDESCLEYFLGNLKKDSKKDINFKATCLEFRDAIGVMRVIYRRISLYLSRYMQIGMIDSFVNELDKIYMKAEYMNLKGIWDNTQFKMYFDFVLRNEAKIKDKILKGLEK